MRGRALPRAGGGAGELVFNGRRASLWEDEDVLDMRWGCLHNDVSGLDPTALCT